MRIRVNKIASVTRRLELGYELILTDKISASVGSVIAGRVLNNKTAYNTLEDVHGRMSKLRKGDVIVGALGHRQALHGYEGVVPDALACGDTIQILNLGGVLGRCTSFNPSVGTPFEVEVLGQVMLYPVFQSRKGMPANISMTDLRDYKDLSLDCPVTIVCGACMNSGKTVAASAIISGMANQGLRVGGAKLTGVSLLQDCLVMKDYGAECTMDFTDVGFASTDEGNAALAAKRIFSLLGGEELDAIVVEMGDGIFGSYGVQQILSDPQLAKLVSLVVYCANDPAGAFGGAKELKDRYNIEADIVSGPVTDNLVGARYIEGSLGLVAINARREPQRLAERVLQSLQPALQPPGVSDES